MKKKVSDYIVDFLVKKGVTDVFGYPGGMVTHLMESFRKREDYIKAHVNYHEQAAAFCACGYAQVSEKTGVAYATSGPGATNLVTGICNAYFDSIPVLFITGQVNSFESKKGLLVRQRGFQETDIITMVRSVTKYCCYLENADDIRKELEKSWYIANEGRKGPVLLDIPMNILRSVIETDNLCGYKAQEVSLPEIPVNRINNMLQEANRPVLLLGGGTKNRNIQALVKKFVQEYRIPVVTSMLAFDLLEGDNPFNYGFIGAYGDRTANFIIAKCDLLLAVGTRLDVRQIGAQKETFAPKAKLVRVEIDCDEFTNKIKEKELEINCEAGMFFQEILKQNIHKKEWQDWMDICDKIRLQLNKIDDTLPNVLIRALSNRLPDNIVITTDVGQNQVWIAQSFKVKRNQKVLFSGGHGAMGYSLPAAIGAFYADRQKIVSFNGDGGFQMNMQELQFIAREKLPITIIIVNNHALGMIRHFQEMYFQAHYYQTVSGEGYSAPDFSKLADAYRMKYTRIGNQKDIDQINWELDTPQIVEVLLNEKTYVYPKLEFGKPNQDQDPLIDRNLYNRIMEL